MDSLEKKEDLIKISDLRFIFNSILDSIEGQLKIEGVTLKKDYYYSIVDDEKYDMKHDPVNYNIGQLLEDWKFLISIQKDGSLATPLNFIHMAPIIDYLATQVDWYGVHPNDAGIVD